MRYGQSETTILLGYLTPGATVEIVLINTKTDTIIPSDDVICEESVQHAGLFRFDTAKIGEITDDVEIAYIMKNTSNTSDIYGGKARIGKWVPEYSADVILNSAQGTQDLRAIIEDVQLGNWEIKDTQMIMRSVSGEEIARFALYDQYGQPNGKSVFKRVRV